LGANDLATNRSGYERERRSRRRENRDDVTRKYRLTIYKVRVKRLIANRRASLKAANALALSTKRPLTQFALNKSLK
jgi:hypothetical protein